MACVAYSRVKLKTLSSLLKSRPASASLSFKGQATKLNCIRVSSEAMILTVMNTILAIHRFTVVCLVAWPLNESETGGDLALVETSLPFLC